jgi:hypothetical protein
VSIGKYGTEFCEDQEISNLENMLQKFNKWCDSKQEACQKVLCEQEVNEIMPGCHPSYLKTVSLQVFSRIRKHFLRFFTPNTAFLVRVIQIHTNLVG